MHYAASTGGFYAKAIHGDKMPTDALPVSPTRYAELLEAQRSGATIRPGPDGAPLAVIPPDTSAERAKATARAMRRGPLSVLDGLQVSALVTKDTAGAKLIEEAKQALRDVPARAAGTKGTYDERLDLVRAEFARIAAMSPDIAKAFA